MVDNSSKHFPTDTVDDASMRAKAYSTVNTVVFAETRSDCDGEDLLRVQPQICSNKVCLFC